MSASLDVLDGVDMRKIDFITRKFEAYRADSLIQRVQSAICLDPKDRLYAISSLLNADFKLDIVPDYSMSTEEVYRDFVVRHIEKTSKLNIIRLVRCVAHCHCHHGYLTYLLKTSVHPWDIRGPLDIQGTKRPSKLSEIVSAFSEFVLAQPVMSFLLCSQLPRGKIFWKYTVTGSLEICILQLTWDRVLCLMPT